MPTPLPAIAPADYAPTLNAFRQGVQDKFVQDQRANLKEAGGLAAAGNYKGATASLYAGGNFDEAHKMQDEIRQIATHAQSMSDHQLERTNKTYELFGRLVPTIQTPEQLEQAKALIKQRTGMDMSKITMEQLPQLQQQNISITDHLNREMEDRKMKASEAYNQSRLDLLKQKVEKTGAPKLTEGQRKAQSYLNVMKDAQVSLKGVLPTPESESPMGSVSTAVTNSGDDITAAKYRSKAQNQYWQAAEQWAEAKLRHQSGATITPDEIRKTARIYFPVPGDDVQTRRNKARARKVAEDSMQIEASGEVAQPNASGADAKDWSDIKVLTEE